MYNPVNGRWLSRDPLALSNHPELVHSHEYVANAILNRLDQNLYLYCRNAPVRFTDPSGLKVIDSGVKSCLGYLAGHWFFSWFPMHGFVALDGKGIGYFEVNLNVTGRGAVRDDELDIYPEDLTRKEGGYSVCTKIEIDDCCYAPETFKSAIHNAIDRFRANPGTYVAGTHEYYFFRATVLEAGFTRGDNGKCEKYYPPVAGAVPVFICPKKKWACGGVDSDEALP